MSVKLFGIADTHVHFLSDLASGGYMLWGKPFPASPATKGENAERECLSHCDGFGGHGPGGVLPSLEGVGHLVGGFPEFDGWPQHGTMAHQQAFIDWIRRAYDGGLRLVVCLAGNSELLATRISEIAGRKFGAQSIDDMSAIRRQVSGMLALRDFIDAQEGGPGRGWLQIALNSAQARDIVAANQLCMVMGVEVAALGGWHSPTELEQAARAAGRPPSALISAMVDELWGLGVRHYFPIHGTNNAFGGAALFVRNYDAANHLATGQSFVVERAPESAGISYRIDQDEFTGGGIAEVLGYHGVAAAGELAKSLGIGLALGTLIGGLAGAKVGVTAAAAGVAGNVGRFRCPPQPVNWAQPHTDRAQDTTLGGHINAQGLTSNGVALIQALGRRGALIDIDHMGEKTTDAVLSLCEHARYPVVSGHTSFRELRFGNAQLTFNKALPPLVQLSFGTANGRNLAREVDKSAHQMARIKLLQGFVGPMLAQSDGQACGCARWAVPNTAAGTSRSFAQAYLYAHQLMGGVGVGFGSDINGAGTLPGPRFGPNAVPGLQAPEDRRVSDLKGINRRSQSRLQKSGVRYSSNPLEYRFSRFTQDGDSSQGAPFDAEERDFWQALVLEKSLARPETADWTGQGPLDGGRQHRVANFAAGLRGQGLGSGPFDYITSPAPGILGNAPLQHAAWALSRAEALPRFHASAEAKRLVKKLKPVWTHWLAMTGPSTAANRNPHSANRLGPAGSGLYDTGGLLRRSTAGSAQRRRDFDVNMDGMAHYGLLPDFLQDLWNIGMPRPVMDSLYHSAHDFIEVWARCESRAANWPSAPATAPTAATQTVPDLLLLL
jgi:Membrane dipeptidase (Peptidase family M19)